ncbi:MAG: hypothetical protein ACW98Y_08780 [Candidatus Thorarchaeota archaeon]|jgi:hypothetical protein
MFIPLDTILISHQEGLLQISGEEHGISLWNHTYGGPQNDLATDTISVRSGGFALTGMLNNPGAVPVGDCFLMRTDSEGNQLWNQTYNSTIMGLSIIEVSTGGFAIAGSNGWLIRTDDVGNLLWNFTYQDAFNLFQINAVIEIRTGGFAMVGTQPGLGHDLSLVLVESNGDLHYRKVYSGPSDGEFQNWGDDRGYDIIEHSLGGYAIAGSLDDRLSLIRVDVVGNLLWRESYHRFGFGQGYSLKESENGGLLVAGVIEGEVHVLSTDSSGNVLWDESYCYANSRVSLVKEIDGRITISANRDVANFHPAWIGHIENNGTLLWERTFPSIISTATVNSLVGYDDDNYILAGSIERNLQPDVGSQIWILAISENPEPTDPLPVEILSLAAIGVLVAVIVFSERFRRKRNV